MCEGVTDEVDLLVLVVAEVAAAEGLLAVEVVDVE